MNIAKVQTVPTSNNTSKTTSACLKRPCLYEKFASHDLVSPVPSIYSTEMLFSPVSLVYPTSAPCYEPKRLLITLESSLTDIPYQRNNGLLSPLRGLLPRLLSI